MKTTDTPVIEKDEIRALIPHAGSMCLLDRVLSWDENTIVCASETHRDRSNPLRRDGRLAALHAFEYGAQAVAIHGGLLARAVSEIAPPGYLAALRDATVATGYLDHYSATLYVKAERLFADKANSVYECRISVDDELLAHGRVTILLRTSADTRRDGLCSVPDPTHSAHHMIPSAHPSLRGHFPGEPIAPGVVILNEIIGALTEATGHTAQLRKFERVKFLSPLRPNEYFTISFATPGASTTNFRCNTAERIIAEGVVAVSLHQAPQVTRPNER